MLLITVSFGIGQWSLVSLMLRNVLSCFGMLCVVVSCHVLPCVLSSLLYFILARFLVCFERVRGTPGGWCTKPFFIVRRRERTGEKRYIKREEKESVYKRERKI